jgi:hypothetical protein
MSEGDFAMTHGSNGNGSNGGKRGDDPLPPAAQAFSDNVRAQLDRQAALFRDVINMNEAAAHEYLNELKKLGDGIAERLHQQDGRIEALQHRLDILEARQAEAERPEP